MPKEATKHAPRPRRACIDDRGAIRQRGSYVLLLADLVLTLTSQLTDHFRQLSEANTAAFLPGLAASMNNLSTRLGDLGPRPEALSAIEEAVAIWRQLAEAGPVAFLPALATSLNNLSVRLADLGRRPEALSAIEEAVGHYRQLAAANPAAFLPDLARSLNTLSIRLDEAGRLAEAAEAEQEASRLQEKSHPPAQRSSDTSHAN